MWQNTSVCLQCCCIQEKNETVSCGFNEHCIKAVHMILKLILLITSIIWICYAASHPIQEFHCVSDWGGWGWVGRQGPRVGLTNQKNFFTALLPKLSYLSNPYMSQGEMGIMTDVIVQSNPVSCHIAQSTWQRYQLHKLHKKMIPNNPFIQSINTPCQAYTDSSVVKWLSPTVKTCALPKLKGHH